MSGTHDSDTPDSDNTRPEQDATSEGENTRPEQDPPKRLVSSADKFKFAGLVFFVALVVLIGVLLFPHVQKFTTEEGRVQLIAMIQHAGIGGIAICLGLQLVQVIVAFIPGEVIQLAIGAIYGPLWGTILTTLGALIASAFVFFVVRKLGAPLVHSMISRKNLGRLKFLQESRQLDVVVFVLFLIPGLPKDLFTYLLPLTDIRPFNFLALSTLARIPAIAASAFIGSAAMQGDYTQAIIIGVIAGSLGLLGIIFNKQILAVIDSIEARLGRRHRR
ncbi:MAG: TVP38/TMEM64 family protein [Coriobacteriales bacterium]|nr:TVP38/TMEM64 family protein [Coriobacteriales bacterium]